MDHDTAKIEQVKVKVLHGKSVLQISSWFDKDGEYHAHGYSFSDGSELVVPVPMAEKLRAAGTVE